LKRAWEWGCGGSTIWLARHGIDVISAESDPQWAEKVRASCDADIRLYPGAGGGLLRSEPEVQDGGRHFFDGYVSAIDEFTDDFDLIVIDGVCREACARKARTKVRRGGIVVVDDTERPFAAHAADVLADWPCERVRGFKRGGFWPHPDVAETSFFTCP